MSQKVNSFLQDKKKKFQEILKLPITSLGFLVRLSAFDSGAAQFYIVKLMVRRAGVVEPKRATTKGKFYNIQFTILQYTIYNRARS